jgi:hypothetical protein
MQSLSNRRVLVVVALLAICAALLLLLVPQGHSTHAAPWLAMLPVFFVGLLTPFCLPRPVVLAQRVRILSAPCRLSRFQRPPPIKRG